MIDQKNGGSAFPQEVHYVAPNGDTGSYGPCGGMTLRDYFAAKAMQAMVSSSQYCDHGWVQDNIASQSYDMADAMLEARK